MYTPLAFNPTKIDLFITDPNDERSIEYQIKEADKNTGIQPSRNFRPFLVLDEIDQNQDWHLDDVVIFVKKLMCRALEKIEGADHESAKRIVEAVVSDDRIEEITRKLDDNTINIVDLILKIAAEAYEEIDFKLYTQSMKYHLEDFEQMFPRKSCVHNLDLVVKGLEDPNYTRSKEERIEYLANNRTASFGIISCMSMYDVIEKSIIPEMKVLLNAGRYQSMKQNYDDAKECYEARTTLNAGDGDEM